MNRKILLITLILIFSLQAVTVFSYAASYTKYSTSKIGTVTENYVNIRSGAGTSYAVKGTASKGKTFTVYGYKKGNGLKWYRITYNGKAAYISSSYVTLSKKPGKVYNYTNFKTGKVTASKGKIRKNVTSGATLLGSVSKGEKITLKGYRKDGSGNKWYKVTYNGSTGFIKASSVDTISSLKYTIYTPFKTGKVTYAGLNVRKSASKSSESKGELAKGTIVTIKGYRIDSSNIKWYRITYKGNAGYIRAKYVDILSSYSYVLYTPYKTGIAKNSSVNIRTGASASSFKIGSFSASEKFTVKGYKYDSNGTKWYRVTYDECAGYVNSNYVNLVSSLSYTVFSPERTYGASKAVTVRKEPSEDSEPLGSLAEGDTVSVKGCKLDISGNKWYVISYNESDAYVRASYFERKVKTKEVSYALVTADSLNVRNGAGTSYDKLGSLSSGDEAEILGTETDSSGNTWYKIEYNQETGYICAEYTEVKVEEVIDDSTEFIAYLEKQGFPESYTSYLKKLHEKHPNWTFKAQKTGISWDDLVTAETKVGVNLYGGSIESFKSMKKGSYDFDEKEYVGFDGSTWVNAYSGLTKYYLDPRNYLNETYIFTFLDQSFDSDTQSISSVKKVVKGTFLNAEFPESTYATYSSCIYYAAKAAGMNPNVLASMIIQEQGVNGKSSLISGTYSGYEGYYNYLNIGAYATGSLTAVQRGLRYARGDYSSSYGLPWNTRAKSIKGGAKWYSSGYITNNQNTLYLKKFNVLNGEDYLGKHQYMTNVQGAASEGSILKDAYEDLDSIELVFSIPVFTDMPASKVSMPSKTGNNNNLLDSLKVSGYSLDSSFTRYDQNYTITVGSSVESIKVTAKANDEDATVTGTGTITLSSGTNKVKVKVKSTSGLTRTYTITVERG